MIKTLNIWIENMAGTIRIAAAILMGFAATIQSVPLFWNWEGVQKANLEVRLSLGSSLALGSEHTLKVGILRAAIPQTWQDFTQMPAIGTLGTVVNAHLERELALNEQVSSRFSGIAVSLNSKC